MAGSRRTGNPDPPAPRPITPGSKYKKSGTTSPQAGAGGQPSSTARPKPGVGKRRGPGFNGPASKRADQALG